MTRLPEAQTPASPPDLGIMHCPATEAAALRLQRSASIEPRHEVPHFVIIATGPSMTAEERQEQIRTTGAGALAIIGCYNPGCDVGMNVAAAKDYGVEPTLYQSSYQKPEPGDDWIWRTPLNLVNVNNEDAKQA